MNARQPIGYVIGIEGTDITLNLLDYHRGMVASHSQGVSMVTEIGSLLGVDAGNRLLVLKVLGVSFAEPKEVHRQSVGEKGQGSEPLRNLSGVIVGVIAKQDRKIQFVSDSLSTPALGAMVYPLEHPELASVLGGEEGDPDSQIRIGDDLRSGASVHISLQDLISRHVAVLGSSGQGKSCFTAAILQQIVKLPGSRTIIFDVNGEYEQAFGGDKREPWVEVTKVGDGFRIPYFALGRQGIQRLLMPSEKTQRPALMFALENLNRVQWFAPDGGLSLVGEARATMFDDCRSGDAAAAHSSIARLRNRTAPLASTWPPMQALGPLIAESYALANARNGWERNAFAFGNVAPLISRVQRFVDDPMFTAVVATEGGPVDFHPELTRVFHRELTRV
jgi:hypothetical protein